ncbi:helix-turn-helix domain-containing protein [Candidatus Formimonas warabiya]|uniref:GAF domain-containing protein n=1 Tax=Formimonas warabiya TaxID=1761012 RepID=A0A3G1KZ77_FORW1|nr:helix-turn-helix domain-containing protein [Candidatus Formimonas warabiya]ATW27697.1 hypothetical protein DCMF_25700 [Candidatus Formimonas warabiya]
MDYQQKLKSYNLLIKMGENITSSLNNDEILDYILKEVIAVFPAADAGVLYLYDEAQDILRLQSYAGFDGDILLKNIPPGVAISGTTFARKKSVIINSVEELKEYIKATPDIPLERFTRGMPFDEYPKAIMSTCLIIHDQIIGVITVDNYGLAQKFSEEDMELLKAAADYAAIAIFQSNMIKKEKYYIKELQKSKQDLEKMLMIQNHFTDIILRETGFPGILDYLAEIIAFPVVLYNILLEPVGHSQNGADCQLPASFLNFSRYNEFVKNKLKNIMPYKVEQETYFISPVIGKNKLLGFLVVFPGTQELGEVEKLALSYASMVAAQEWLKQDAVFETAQKGKGDLFHGALSGFIDKSLIQHAEKLGLDYRDYFGVIMVKKGFSTPDSSLEEAAREDKLLKDIISLLGRYSINGIVIPERNLIYVMVSFPKSTKTGQKKIIEIGCEILQLNENIQITVGQLYENLSNLSKSYTEAWECFEILDKYPMASKIINYEQLGILHLILKLETDELNSYIDKILKPLLDYDAQKDAGLLDTLQAYISFNKNIKNVAENMNIHYNTAYWRIKKAEEILHQDFGNTQDWFNVQAACMLYGIINRNEGY